MAARRDRTNTLALRGALAALVLLLASAGTVAIGAGAFTDAPVVQTALPASAGPIKAQSPVRYRGVTVGRLTAVDASTSGAVLTLRMDPELVDQVPAAVRTRLLPRTLFGDQYIDLAVPDGARAGGSLRAGARIPADTSGRTVRLYTAYRRLYQLIDAVEPAKLQVALSTVADAMRGKGDDLGRLIDDASALFDESQPMLDSLGADLGTFAEFGEDLAAAGPDLLASMRDAVALSDTIVAERDSLRDVLGAGIALTGQSRRTLTANADRIIQLTEATGPVADVLAKRPNALTESIDAAAEFLEAGKRAFSTGRFKIDVVGTLDNPYPYTARDCPRYPGMAGPNCGNAAPEPRRSQPPPQRPQRRAQAQAPQGGTVGPVGGPGEDGVLRELAPLLPGAGGKPPNTDLLGLMLGPLVRGTRVIVP